MAQKNSKFPAQLDTFVNHGSKDGIGLDIDWQKSDELSSEEVDLITDAILEVERELGTDPAGAYATVGAWLTALQADVDGALENIVEDLTPQLGGELDAQANTIGFTQQTATGDGTTTVDWRLGNKFYFTFGAQNDIFTFIAPTYACNLILVLKQDGVGSRLATWPGTVLWPSNVAPTLSTGVAAVDIVALYWDGTSYHSVANLNFS